MRSSAMRAAASEIVEKNGTEDNKENEGLCKQIFVTFVSFC
jgi:hypothetical protein